jgi:hypothetical protein
MANLYNHFEKNPVSVKVPRSKIPLPFQIKTSFNFGELCPFYVQEVLPGDTFDLKTSFVARTQTPLVPVMDNSFLDYYYFFIPNRLAWSHWEELMGANKTATWATSVDWQCPLLSYTGSQNRLFERFGVPVNPSAPTDVLSFPILDYYLTWNQWFRDENYETPLYIDINHENNFVGALDTFVSPNLYHFDLLPVNRFHDYFTSCLPNPQKGNSAGVSSNIGQLPVYGGATNNGHVSSPWVSDINGSVDTLLGLHHPGADTDGTLGNFSGTGLTGGSPVTFKNLYADGSTASNFISVNDLRMSFQVQKMLERDARGGTRYNEVLYSHFGVVSPDSALQIPEYLFGCRVPMHINQVVQTAGSGTGQVGGATYGQSQTNDFRSNFKKSFTEHGFVLGVVCARTEQTYSQGLEKFWLKKKRLDFYTPELANISEQPVFNKEIYNDPSSPKNDEVFGYNEAWADYRVRQNRACGVFNPVSGDLKEWTYANAFSALPTRGGLTEETKDNVARTLAVLDSDQVFMDIFVDNEAVRAMPAYSVPGLVDHN